MRVHYRARSVGGVFEKLADVFGGFGLRALHAFKEPVPVLLLQLADDVGGVVGLHLVED